MADPYVDVFETLIYGKLASREMRRLVMPLNPAWAGTVAWCIEEQDKANARMAAIVARLELPEVNDEELEKVTDTIVRFGYWIASLPGNPLDAYKFFAGHTPSDIGEARLSKLPGHLERMINALEPHAAAPPEERIEGVVSRIAALREAHAIAERNRAAQQLAQQARVDLRPEATAAREDWLKAYIANKYTMEGLLRHADKLEWKSLIFDDLAEEQRSKTEVEGGEDLDALVTSPPGGPAPQPADGGEDPTAV